MCRNIFDGREISTKATDSICCKCECARTNIKCFDFCLSRSKENIKNLSHGLSLRFLCVVCIYHALALQNAHRVYFQHRAVEVMKSLVFNKQFHDS